MRQQQREASRGHVPPTLARTQGTQWGWLLAVIVIVGVLGATIVIYIRANQARFIVVSLLANVQEAQRTLDQNQGNFTLADVERLRRILSEVEQLGRAQKELDRESGGHLLFFVQVVKEMAAGPALQPGELDKMESLLAATRQQLQQRKPSP
jgi:hypothetical protein